MTAEKGLDPEKADKIGQYVLRAGQEDLVEELLKDATLCTSKSAVEGLEALKLFFRYAELFDVKKRVRFDMSLARGLDYYTGIIYEAILTSKLLLKMLGQEYAKKFDLQIRIQKKELVQLLVEDDTTTLSPFSIRRRNLSLV